MALKRDISIAWQIFCRDVRRLVANPIALIVVLGCCLMPSLYAWTTIIANWNPYGNTGALKVAVANEDAGAKSALTGELNVGDLLEEEMKKTPSFDWQFVDEEEALRLVESGECYAAFVVPEDFSEDFLSILTGDFTQPELDYYVNEKVSDTAPEFTDEGATVIEDEINQTFVQMVSETVMKLAQQAGVEVEGGATGAEGSLTRGVTAARDVISSTRTALADLTDGFSNAQGEVDVASTAFDGLLGELPGLAEDVEDAKEDLEALRGALGTYGTQLTGALTQVGLDIGQAARAAEGAAAKAEAAITKAEGATSAALAGAKNLVSQNERVLTTLQALLADHPALEQVISRLEGENAELGQTVGALEDLDASLKGVVDELEGATGTVDAAAEAAAEELGEDATTLQGQTIPALTSSLDAFADALGTLRGIVISLEPIVEDTVSTLGLLDSSLAQAQTAAAATDSSLASIEGVLEGAAADLQALATSSSMEELATYLGLDPKEVGEFMGSPVKITTIARYPVKNYGSSVAPFYTNLALWVSGFVLTAVLKVGINEEDLEGLPPLTTTQAYLGRWLLFMVLGLIQGLIVCVGDLVIGIQCLSPVAYVFAGLVTVIVDVNILYALVFTMRHLGRAIGVVLIIVQIPGSSGEFPVQMMPPFFQAIHPLLPFTYSIEAMREAIGGFYDGRYWACIAALLPFIGIALAVGLVAGRYAFNLNALFDEELSDTDLLVSEDPGAKVQHFRIRHVLRALLDVRGYRAWVEARVEKFHQTYPLLLKIGWIAIGALPVATLALAFAASADAETKVVLLALMVLGIVAVAIYLIVVEFMERNLESQLALSEMGPGEVREHAEARAAAASDAREGPGDTHVLPKLEASAEDEAGDDGEAGHA